MKAADVDLYAQRLKDAFKSRTQNELETMVATISQGAELNV